MKRRRFKSDVYGKPAVFVTSGSSKYMPPALRMLIENPSKQRGRATFKSVIYHMQGELNKIGRRASYKECRDMFLKATRTVRSSVVFKYAASKREEGFVLSLK